MWKTIPFELEYEVSNTGEVRNKTTKHIKSLRFSRGGYLRVTLYPSGKTYTVHRLVALVFLTKHDDDVHVNHLDGNKTNNKVVNLEWCTARENFLHAINIGLHIRKDISGCNNPMSKFKMKDIEFIIKNLSNGLTVSEIAKVMSAPYERVRRVAVRQHYKN